MAKHRGKKGTGNGSPRLPQGDGDEGALVLARGVVAAPPPPPAGPVATVTKTLRSFFTWRRNVRVEVAADLPRVEVSAELPRAATPKEEEKPPRVENQAWQEKGRPKRPRQQQRQVKPKPEPAQRSTSNKSDEEYMVEGLAVPKWLKSQYKEYCRQSARQPETVTFCHMCFFHRQRAHNCIFPAKKEMMHYASHEDEGPMEPCPVEDCRVRVGPDPRERQLHIHFCHIKPAGWWNQEDN
ncbi:unnamed protein product [Urochloa humidicola]